jgi:hypothetical protein
MATYLLVLEIPIPLYVYFGYLSDTCVEVEMVAICVDDI